MPKRQLIRLRFVLIFAGALVGYWALHVGLGWYMRQPAACSQPCHDVATCPVGDISLDIAAPGPRTGKVVPVWYKASFKNTSCADYSLYVDFFVSGESKAYSQQPKDGFYFEFADAAGRPITPTPASRLDGKRRWPAQPALLIAPDSHRLTATGAFPYDTDESKLTPLLRRSVNSHVDMHPGDEAWTLPSIYSPHIFTDAPIAAAGPHTTIKVAVDAKSPSAATPPPGYRYFNHFIFTAPGDYRFKLGFKGTITLRPRYRYQAHAAPLRNALSLLAGIVGALPPAIHVRHVSLESATSVLDVRP